MKVKFSLSVTSAKKDAITRVLSTCEAQPLPLNSGSSLEVSNNITEPTPTQNSGTAGPAGPGTSGITYENCDAVRAAGAAPIHRGEPGYSSSLDGDSDGVGCE